jgi:hypothetical protein
MQMMASQARLKLDDDGSGAEAILGDTSLSEPAKRETLQGMFTMAASNGQLDRVRSFLDGPAKSWVDLDAVDSEGTPPLIYASCFGHQEVVKALLDAGANVNKQDKNQWSALMWAMTNRHKGIAKLLLDHGADPDVKSSTGRTAHDFLAPNSEMSDYLHESGYSIGNAGVGDDFYNAGMAEDRFEEELAENEMRRRMMMESAINLEVDLGNLGMDEQPEVRCILFLREIHANHTTCSHQTKQKKPTTSSGTAASTTKCSSSKNRNSTASSTSSSQT